MSKSPVITVLANESTDITVTKRLTIYAQITNPKNMLPSTEFVTNVKITEGTGAAISGKIIQQLKSFEISNPRNIMGLGSDGASAMTGINLGTAGMMTRENPHLLSVHCVAHRLALVTSQAAEEIPALKDYQETITSLYYYFKNSPCRQDKLSKIQNILDSPCIKYKEVHSVRWLSFYIALEAVYRTLDSLLTYLAEANPQKDPKAAGLKKKGTLPIYLAIFVFFFLSTSF